MTKRSKLREQVLESDLTWKKITQFITGNVDKKEHEEIKENFKEILQAAKQIVGTDHGQEAIESGASYLFKIFNDKDGIGQIETMAIKQMFGPFPSSSATAAFNAIYNIVSRLNEDKLKKLLLLFGEQRDEGSEFFGKNLNFSLDMYALEETEDMPLNWNTETKDISLDFRKFHSDHIETPDGTSGGQARHNRTYETEDDSSFLYDEVKKYVMHNLQSSSGGPTVNDLCSTLFEMLASTKSNDELQNELFELLGPEGLTFIEMLLQQRQKIVERSLNYDNKMYTSQEQRMRNYGENTKPNYGCQVTVQSEQEKQLMKQYRREEKRNNQRTNE
uniref:MGC69365 protein n=1 Tax=Xenopus tropicalis TaxID=8364 RepID=Q6GLE2_XENTR|eukprot:NP_001004802.1 activating signal cointegrator 1 complex subunit 3 [Xenopus tropicalis]